MAHIARVIKAVHFRGQVGTELQHGYGAVGEELVAPDLPPSIHGRKLPKAYSASRAAGPGGGRSG